MKFVPKIFQEDKYHYLALFIYTIVFFIKSIIHPLLIEITQSQIFNFDIPDIIITSFLFISIIFFIFSVLKDNRKKIKIISFLMILLLILRVYFAEIFQFDTRNLMDYSKYWIYFIVYLIPAAYSILYFLYKFIRSKFQEIILLERSKTIKIAKNSFLFSITLFILGALYFFIAFFALAFYSRPSFLFSFSFLMVLLYFTVFLNIISFIFSFFSNKSLLRKYLIILVDIPAAVLKKSKIISFIL